MFTGIIEEIGTVLALERKDAGGARLSVACRAVLSGSAEGSSIAVNGVCLTALDITAGTFAADLAPETLQRTNLGDLTPGAEVNLERPVAVGDRLSGHIVQGHVDGTAEVAALRELGDGNWWLEARIAPEQSRYVIEKGSIALDGISLTVAAIEHGLVSVAIIPHTFEHTTVRRLRPGSRLNVEFDLIAKYVEKLLPGRQP